MPTFPRIRRTAACVLAAAALAGGGVALAAPAHAMPRCTSLIATYEAWMDQWTWDIENQSGQAAEGRDAVQAAAAYNRADAAGCM